MDNEEKKIVKNTLVETSFLDYKGNKKLYEKSNELDDKYGGLKILLRSEKRKMKYTNEFFPLFLNVWKTEKDILKEYLIFDVFFIKVMEKYYE